MQSFKDDFIKAWVESGGLITKIVASKICGLSDSQINHKVKKGELTKYEIDGQPSYFVSFQEIVKVKRKRKKKGTKN